MKNWERYFGTPEAAMRMEVRMMRDGRRFRIAVSECNPFTSCAFESRWVRDFASWGRVPELAQCRIRRRDHQMGGGRSMTNWEHFFGTPERAALMDVEFYAIPAMVAVKREEKAGDAATLRLVARFDSREEYLAWLKSERCGE